MELINLYIERSICRYRKSPISSGQSCIVFKYKKEMNWIRSAKHSLMDLYSGYTPDDSLSNNGNIMCNIYLPSEVVALILSFVDNDTLTKKGRYVCKEWNELIKTVVWKFKAEREYNEKFKDLKLTKRLPWEAYHCIAQKKEFGRNLLKNNCGQNGFKYWNIENLSDGWKVESPPIGMTIGRYRGIHKSCFVTSCMVNRKSQLVDLCKEGIHPDILDLFQPDIFISECFGPRWDCGSFYSIVVKLLGKFRKNKPKEVLQEFSFNKTMEPVINGWEEISHTFESYGPGVRYIHFTHAGTDTQYLDGQYGSKMTNARVEVHL